MDKYGPGHAAWLSRGRRHPIAQDQSGAAAIEYALLAALIALAIVAALTRTGTSVGSNFNEVDQAMPGGVEFHTP